MEQGSDLWHEIKRGVPSSSNFDRILTPGAGGRFTCVDRIGNTCGTKHTSLEAAEKCSKALNKRLADGVPFAPQKAPLELAAAHKRYIAELIGELKCAHTPNFFTGSGNLRTGPMEEGARREPEARDWYERTTNQRLQQVGFIQTEDLRFGCSPDSLVVGHLSAPLFDDENPTYIGGLELKCPQPTRHVEYVMDTGELLNDYKHQVHGSLIVSGFDWWDLVSYCPPLPAVKLRVVRDEYTKQLAEAMELFWDAFTKYRDLIEGMI